MATMVVVCSGLGWKKLTYLLTATVYLAHPRTHMVPWRICYKYKQVTSNKNLVFVGRNRKKSQKQLREPK
ncbi:small ribosomal subunit protein bS18m-like isoform X3 [Saimiri boliviensis]|uniref:small ribosomal subunit protein bS18m-like isoform X3 n=1 Tax=Saimiri boliviensis TaxID=27679 RepID=UPI00193E323B|nr:28S ribosomal protein S18c, mitochondrial-like isoform X3 [Saimiri boliviensis boliviensis]